MKAAEIRNKAFTEFLNGKSLREISTQEGMACKRTLEKWSVRDSWNDARNAARAEARQKAITARVPVLADEYAEIEAGKYKIAMKAVAQLIALVEGDLTEADLSMSKTELIRLIGQLMRRR